MDLSKKKGIGYTNTKRGINLLLNILLKNKQPITLMTYANKMQSHRQLSRIYRKGITAIGVCADDGFIGIQNLNRVLVEPTDEVENCIIGCYRQCQTIGSSRQVRRY